MKLLLAFLVVVAIVFVEVSAKCDFNECDTGCTSRGNLLGRCKNDNLCECVQVAQKCNPDECDLGCRSRGNTLGRCKGDRVCECVVING